VSISGQNVAQPSRNDPLNPDVIFSAAGDVVVTVQGEQLPEGSAVKLRLSAPGTLIEKPAANEPKITLAKGKANFNLTVPKGAFTIQAFADLQ